MFPATKQMVRPVLLASLVLALSQAPAFAQRRIGPTAQWTSPLMSPTSLSQTPSFSGLYGNGVTPFSTGSGNFSASPSTNPFSAYGLGNGSAGSGVYGPGYGVISSYFSNGSSYGLGGYSGGGYGGGGYGGYGPGYGMEGAGLYTMPNVASYFDPPDYSSSRYKESPADLEMALREASSKPDRLSQAQKKANLRKRLDKYLFLTNDEEKQKNTAAP
jgi:hypothetical protein